MTFRQRFPADKYPLSNELCAFMDAHPEAKEALKFSNDKRFIAVPLIFTSHLPAAHKRSADEVIGVWCIDMSGNLCPRHHTVCQFKQDFIVNLGQKNQEYVVYSADRTNQKYSRPIKEFFNKYGHGGKYYHNGKEWHHHYATIDDLPDEPNLRALTANMLRQHDETALIEEIKSLHEMNDYAYSLLKGSEKKVDLYSLGIEAYLLGLFLSAIAQVQGMILLAENKQVRVSNNLFRTLYEVWVNTRFAYCHRSNVFAKFIVVNSERSRVKKAEILHSDGHISDEQLDRHRQRLSAMLKSLAKQYPTWPDNVPGAINISKTTPATLASGLSLKQRCMIIDFYNQKFHRTRKKSLTMVQHYDRMYPHMSDGVHAGPLELSSVIKEKPEYVDITLDGSNDLDGMKRLCSATFTLEYEITKFFKYYILKERPVKMASWINVTAREKGIIK